MQIQLLLIKTTCFTSLLLQIKPVIIKTINCKFDRSLRIFREYVFKKEAESLVFCDFYYYDKSHLFWKIHWNTSSCSEDIKILFFNIHYFHCFSDFLIFPCCKETNEFSIYQTMSAHFYVQPILNGLFNYCIKLYRYWIRSSWNMNVKGREGVEEGSSWPSHHSRKNYLQKFQAY